jgi:hypothetical protein
LFIVEHWPRDALIVIILHFDDLHTFMLAILRAIPDKQALTTADEWRRCAVTVDVLAIVSGRGPKDAGQEFEDPIDSILLGLVPLAGDQSFLPEVLIGCFEFIKISGDSLLVTLDGTDTAHDGVDIQELGTALTRKGNIAVSKINVLLAAAFAIFSGDKTKKIGLSSVEIRMFKVPKLCFGIALQDALLEVGYLVKSVHVQLSNEGRKISMLEKPWKDVIRKALVLEDWEE